MKQLYLTEAENLEDLVSRMPDNERLEWGRFGHLRLESAFADRVFVLYQAVGRDSKGVQRPPKIATTVRVVNFRADSSTGCEMKLLDETTQKTMTVGHVPQKLLGYPIYACLPPAQNLRWDARHAGREILRSLSFVMLVKCANKAEFFSKDNYYMETVNKLRKLYGHLELSLDL